MLTTEKSVSEPTDLDRDILGARPAEGLPNTEALQSAVSAESHREVAQAQDGEKP